ncbi:hypothetical protein T10_10521 [Trichinella papuae]|uniref:Uncharacterized protein n=1 Tax=Trichinella papuae TaxID=268474 RepID=A0A0V1MGY6_9BILA|nr:hypothetical protein T10_10521 [Trichinella papuae]
MSASFFIREREIEDEAISVASWGRDAESATPMSVDRRTIEMDLRPTDTVGLTLPSSIKASPNSRKH